MTNAMHALMGEFERAGLSRPVGRVTAVQGGMIRLSGLARVASIGDRLELRRQNGSRLKGEVVQIDSASVHMMPDTAPERVSVGDAAVLSPVPAFAPCQDWIGRVVDPYGQPLDELPLPKGAEPRDVIAGPPRVAQRKPLGERLATGLSVLNTLLPVVRGQRIGLFAGSGVGKSRLLSLLAANMEADVVVIAMIGERGREVNEFVNRVLGPQGMKRSVLIVATSDQPAAARRRCAWSAMAVAEHFRDAGQNVLFLVDSVTRLAEAHREISTTSGDTPSLRGFPPSVTPLLTALCERAGPGLEGQGDITALFSVLVAGSDMDEPIADILRGTLDGHIVLDRKIAERGRFPAIDVGRSVSRSLPDAASERENQLIGEIRKLLGAYEQSEVMIKAGLYQEGSDPLLDRAVLVWPELDEFFGKSDSNGIANSFERLGLILRRAGISV